MATTGAVINLLVSGVVNTSTGAALASGRARFYQPGTLTAQNVYSDDACTTAITQPYTLGAGGEAKLFMLDPVRIIVKDSSDTTTHLDTVIIQRHDQQYITHTSFNSGAETTLEAILTTSAASLGADLKYKESSSATARNYSAWMANTYVSVLDFAADPTGTSDAATAFTNAINEAIDSGCKRVYVDPGTYRIDTAITAIDTAGVEIFGAGRGRSTIRNHGTTTNLFTVNISGDSKLNIHDLTFTANTTSSGACVAFTAGDRAIIERCSFLLHRTSISAATPSGVTVRDCVVESTDDNAAAVGITVGPRGRVLACEVVSGTDNGTGIELGADARAVDCYVSNFVTGILMSGVRSRAIGAHVNGSTTGASMTGQGSTFRDGYVTGCTTGTSHGAAHTSTYDSVITSCTSAVSVGAFARCKVIGNDGSSNTNGVVVNASATLIEEYGNSNLGTLSDSATTPHSWLKDRGKVKRKAKETFATATPTFTPTPQTADIFVAESTYTAAGTTVTFAATSTTGLLDGQMLVIVLYKNGANSLTSATWNAQYKAATNIAGVANGEWFLWNFTWHAATSSWNYMPTQQLVGATAGTTYW